MILPHVTPGRTTLDDPAVAEVLAEHCADEFSAVDDRMRVALVELQLRARLGGFADAFPEAHARLLVRDGGLVGYAIVDSRDTSIHLVDLVVRPAFRRTGAATALLGELTTEADSSDRDLTLSVTPGSPAERLYAAHGFARVEDAAPDALHVGMRRAAASVPPLREDIR
ncbi:GNAT family N-acetyltransferase [Microbacterium sp. ASV49]|uniref:GNAT family N-acetyltransferase n=1 Tax=Microbacterium candidum TaxID=3041922 RepID=A0ABT7MYJ1_9MICO|nr:GNAT family N-acetyltransferase [Microbacterium sp. ASV49]MDL9979514.1 GNAT family N-acetyltransferase [Microbacterium sp. ASV49]